MTIKIKTVEDFKRPHSYRDLGVYKLSHKLGVGIHNVSFELPKLELFEEGSQICKSSKAIPTNIVEGFGRRQYKSDFIRFLVYAHSSCDETIEHLKLLFDTDSLDKQIFEYYLDQYLSLGKKHYRFLQSVEKGHLT